ncbi:MAG TPA: hypothetical protein VJ978_14110, partial [Nitriliruptoraceae bacterium]|nr:hypothetical protein [Nitriliruptoraceae bacterium]
DLDLWAFWTRDPLGRVVAVVVVVMVGTAAVWLRALVRSAIRSPRAQRHSTPRRGAIVAGALGVAAAWVAVGWVAGVAVGALAWWVHRAGHAAAVAEGLDEVADLAAVGMAAGLDLPAALRQAAAHVPDPLLAHQVASLALRLSLDPPGGDHDAGWSVGALGGAHDTGRSAGALGGAHDTGRSVGALGGAHHTGRSAGDPGIAPLRRLVVDIAVTGQPAAAPLRRLAVRLRRDQADRVRVAVARLPARLTLPTTLLLVPATVLAIGAPIAMRGLQAIAGS